MFDIIENDLGDKKFASFQFFYRNKRIKCMITSSLSLLLGSFACLWLQQCQKSSHFNQIFLLHILVNEQDNEITVIEKTGHFTDHSLAGEKLLSQPRETVDFELHIKKRCTDHSSPFASSRNATCLHKSKLIC